MPFRIDEAAELHFDPYGDSHRNLDHDDGTIRLPYDLVYRPTTEFSYEAAMKRLTELDRETSSDKFKFFTSPGNLGSFHDHDAGEGLGLVQAQGQLLKISATIDMDSRLSVGCAGAVLAYIGRHKAMHQLPGDTSASHILRVGKVEMFGVENMMFINADTLASLQILRSDSNPNAHSQGPSKGVSGSKEGLSIYGLFHRLARTSQGRQLLRQWFSRPTLDLSTIQERLESIETFLMSDNETSMKKVVKNLGQVKNIKTILLHLQKGMNHGLKKGGVRSSVWSNIRLFAFHSLQIRDAMSEIIGAEHLQIGKRVFANFDTQTLASIGEQIGEVINFQASADMHRTVVNSGIDRELDNLKRSYSGMEHLLDNASKDIAATIPRTYVVNLKVIFFPLVGFLITVQMDSNGGTVSFEGGFEEGFQWDHIFSADGMKFYKDYRMRELDESWGDVYTSICDKEIEIVHRLAQDILVQTDLLGMISEVCGELDSLTALAQGARLYGFCKPILTQDNFFDIRGSRHPLQELCVASFVPNDVHLQGGHGPVSCSEADKGGNSSLYGARQDARRSKEIAYPSMLIMTGPNFSGKSVFLKQVALVVYMAHVGCFVPAHRAVIGLTDKILTRIATRETVSRIQSAFMNDLQQVALATTLVTRRSLLLLDEFGKGTDSHDGVGLACGVFDHFLKMGDERPKVLAATHFHEMFENGFLKANSSLAFGYMEVRVDEKAKDVDDQIIYLYNVRPGRKNSSYGSFCAAKNGVDDAIIARSEELEELSAKGEDIVAACARVSTAEEENLSKAERVARDFLVQDMREMQGSPEKARLLLSLIT
ncbi:uncharacterized protein KY384_002186 [Bacidia gigantensis]|uniref:uncharacterized protein n=1 Tax=Bacidia gigantensis TaxID=2732470 RepID=UPI001D0398FA|nr:uncharacterized protein KY384_002186 [Bacidia gigantensis]KAG8533403.1 hypothetical protein KY384_002186 [Bacidia gigantensis]